MANFETAYKKTARYEGGYANNPADRGGETYAGIARKFWPKWMGWKTIDAIKRTAKTPQQINAAAQKDEVLKAQIKDFYKVNFWGGLTLVSSQRIADTVYDMRVNSGVLRTNIMLQKAINNLGGNLTEDGILGDKSMQAINSSDPEALFTDFNRLRENYYRTIAKGTQAQFLAGWLKRLESYV